jgi:hypothetical protein
MDCHAATGKRPPKADPGAKSRRGRKPLGGSGTGSGSALEGGSGSGGGAGGSAEPGHLMAPGPVLGRVFWDAVRVALADTERCVAVAGWMCDTVTLAVAGWQWLGGKK